MTFAFELFDTHYIIFVLYYNYAFQELLSKMRAEIIKIYIFGI